MSNYAPKERSSRPRPSFRPAPAATTTDPYPPVNYNPRAPRRYPPPASEYVITEIRMSQNPSPVGHLSEINSQDDDYFRSSFPQDQDYGMDQDIDYTDQGHDHDHDQDRDQLAVVPTRPTALSPASSRMSIDSTSGRSRKGRSNPSSSTRALEERHRSDDRLSSDSRNKPAPNVHVRTSESKGRISDTLKSHSKPQAFRSSPSDSSQSSHPQMSHASHTSQTRVERPKSKLNQSTKFDTPSESGKSSYHGSSSRPRSHRDNEPVEVGSPVPKPRFKRPLDVRERDRDRYPDIVQHQSRSEVESRSSRISASQQVNHDINQPEPTAIIKKSTKTKDILQLSDDDDDGDLLASSDTELELAGMLGEKNNKKTTEKPGKLHLDMPRSLDHVLKKIIGPMIKKVVASRSEAASEVSDQWEWSRLDVLGQEMDSAMIEARESIQGAQQIRHDDFENAKNKRIEYETHTTKVYKDHGKDYRVLCNDLTGNNNRAVKKIKREIRGASKSGGGVGGGGKVKVEVQVQVPSGSGSGSVSGSGTRE